jgi:NADH:quinone reductase (non-electrogenic)
MKPRIIIVGAGFGGLEAARRLRNAEVDLTVVDRTNHHIFQPLLYQVATATLTPSEITAPIRWLLRKQANTRVLLGEVRAIDVAHRTISLDTGDELPYDYLILAAGARHSYFSHPEWEATAPGLKSIEDAVEIRRRFLLAFERAERLSDPDERMEQLTFVVVGGGPTGVELAGMLPTIARHTLAGEFRNANPADSKTILLEGGPRILPSFPEDLSRRAERDLRDLGVDVRVGKIVTRVESNAVWIGDDRIPTRTVFWAAGNAASALGKLLGVPTDRAGRVIVQPDLSIPGHPEIFVVGDMAAMQSDGRPVPGVAQGAIQSGREAAKNILRTIRHEGRGTFRYHNKGDMATIGRYRAIADLGRIHLTGWFAWLGWLLLHIMLLVGFRNRISVLIEWAYAYFTYQRGSRLITEPVRHNLPPTTAEPPKPGW